MLCQRCHQKKGISLKEVSEGERCFRHLGTLHKKCRADFQRQRTPSSYVGAVPERGGCCVSEGAIGGGVMSPTVSHRSSASEGNMLNETPILAQGSSHFVFKTPRQVQCVLSFHPCQTTCHASQRMSAGHVPSEDGPLWPGLL